MADETATEVEASTEGTIDNALETSEVSFETTTDVEETFIDSDNEDFDDEDEEDDGVEEDSTEDESTEPASEEEEATEDDPQLSPEEQQKAHNREMAQKRLEVKAQREAEIKAQQDKYLQDADPEDPRDLALRQLQIDAYNNNVDKNESKLTSGYERAIKDFDILRDQNPVIQAALDDALDSFQARYVSLDEYGNPTKVGGDLYAYLQLKADSIAELSNLGAKKQEAAKAKEKSKAMTRPSRTPKTAKVDADVAGFDEEAARW